MNPHAIHYLVVTGNIPRPHGPAGPPKPATSFRAGRRRGLRRRRDR